MGELSALASALLWAVNGTLLRAQASRSAALTLNAVQYLSAAIASLAFLLPLGYVGRAFSLDGSEVLYLAASALIGLVGGDTLYIMSLRVLGIARAFPLCNSLYVLLTTLVAVVGFQEAVGLAGVAGAMLVVVGISCIALAQGDTEGQLVTTRAGYLRGILVCATAALCWTISIFLLRVVLADIDVLTANTIRLPLAALLLVNLAYLQDALPSRAELGYRSLAMVGAAGILGIALGSLAFLFAVQTAGAAKTAVLNSSSPLFAVLLSLIFFRREVTALVGLGTALCVAGVALIAWS